jgi:hypothetical protein
MNRRKWLWFSLTGIPLVAAGALAASTLAGGKSTSQQLPQVEVTAPEECCSTSECCKDCPPDCPPEACPLCTK